MTLRQSNVISYSCHVKIHHAKLGVPKSSVPDTLRFILYTTGISSLLPTCVAAGNIFANDIQAFVHGPPSSQLLLVARIQSFTDCQHFWMSSNQLNRFSSPLNLWVALHKPSIIITILKFIVYESADMQLVK